MAWDYAPEAEPPMTRCTTCRTWEPISHFGSQVDIGQRIADALRMD